VQHGSILIFGMQHQEETWNKRL